MPTTDNPAGLSIEGGVHAPWEQAPAPAGAGPQEDLQVRGPPIAAGDQLCPLHDFWTA
jgi:hypothetical protein